MKLLLFHLILCSLFVNSNQQHCFENGRFHSEGEEWTTDVFHFKCVRINEKWIVKLVYCISIEGSEINEGLTMAFGKYLYSCTSDETNMGLLVIKREYAGDEGKIKRRRRNPRGDDFMYESVVSEPPVPLGPPPPPPGWTWSPPTTKVLSMKPTTVPPPSPPPPPKQTPQPKTNKTGADCVDTEGKSRKYGTYWLEKGQFNQTCGENGVSRTVECISGDIHVLVGQTVVFGSVRYACYVCDNGVTEFSKTHGCRDYNGVFRQIGEMWVENRVDLHVCAPPGKNIRPNCTCVPPIGDPAYYFSKTGIGGEGARKPSDVVITGTGKAIYGTVEHFEFDGTNDSLDFLPPEYFTSDTTDEGGSQGGKETGADGKPSDVVITGTGKEIHGTVEHFEFDGTNDSLDFLPPEYFTDATDEGGSQGGKETGADGEPSDVVITGTGKEIHGTVEHFEFDGTNDSLDFLPPEYFTDATDEGGSQGGKETGADGEPSDVVITGTGKEIHGTVEHFEFDGTNDSLDFLPPEYFTDATDEGGSQGGKETGADGEPSDVVITGTGKEIHGTVEDYEFDGIA